MSESPIRILLVEDNPGDVRLIQAMLEATRGIAFDLQHEERLSAGLEHLAAGGVDAILLDLSLPDSAGLDTFIQVQGRAPQVPIIVLTGLDDESLAVQSVRDGAQDYLVKGQVNGELLVRAVRYAIERKRVAEALRRAHDELELRVQERTAELQQVNEALRQAEIRYRSLFEGVPVGIYRTTPDGEFLDANPALVRMLGYPDRDTLLGIKTTELYLNAEDRQQWQVLVERQGVVRDFEAQMRRFDGTPLWGRDTARAVRDADGYTIYYEGSLEDVTERKRAAEALQKAHDELEVRVRERTADLARESDINATIAELSRALITSVSLEDISALVLEHARRFTGSAFGFVGYVDPQTGHFVSSAMTWDVWESCQVDDKDTVLRKFGGLCGWVLENCQPVLSNDLAGDARSSGVPEGHIPIHRFLSVPALVGEELVGQIALANADRAYEERDLVLVERLASLYAIAVQRHREEEALRRYAGEQAALYAVTSAVTTFLDPDQLLTNVLDVVLPILGANVGWVMLPGSTLNDPARVAASRGVPESFLTAETAGPLLACPFCAEMLRSTDEQVEPSLIVQCPVLPPEVLEEADLGSHVAIPLNASRRVLGILNVAWPEPRPYPETDRTLLTTIGRQVGLALRNAQLYQSARQVDRLQVLNDLDQVLATTLDPRLVAEVTLRQMSTALNAPASALFLLPSHEGAVPEEAFVLPRGWITLVHSEAERQRLQAFQQRFFQRREPTLLLGVELTQIEFESFRDLDLERWGTWGIIVPIWGDEQEALALLALGGRPKDRPFTDEDMALAQTAASRAGQAIQNARLYRDTHARADELALLNEIGLILTSTLDYPTVVHDALTHVHRLFQAENVSLLRPDPQTGELYFVRALVDGNPVEIAARLQPGEGVAGWALAHRRPVLIEDAQTDPRFSDHVDRELGSQTRALMAVPLLTPDRAIGVIEVVSDEPGVYDRAELRTLQALASTLAVALENARLYDELKMLLQEREQAQAQLIHSEKMSALGRLVASIAHEINNPLQSMQGCLTLTMEELAGQQRRDRLDRYLDIVGDEIERVSNIVRRMRDFYRPVRAGLQRTDLHAVVDSVLALSGKQLQHSEVLVEREWDPDLPEIQANPDHFKQVFLNLVLNAIDAMPQGGMLRVRTARDQIQIRDEQQARPAVRIEFSDTGKGMSPDELSRIFEPFFTTKEEGSGLGLSVTYGIIEAHNGQIAVTSQEGVGTTFTILLPVEQPAMGPAESRLAPGEGERRKDDEDTESQDPGGGR